MTPASDYRCECALAAPRWSLQIKSGALRLPAELAVRGQTALLEIELEPRFSGRLSDPWIEVVHREGVYRQYFERGASGRRLLNLSPVFQATPDSRPVGAIRLRGSGLRYGAAATLRVFAPPELQDASVLVIAPHPDDAEIACFGLYATRRASIVTLTAGERGGVSPDRRIGAEEAARWRAQLRTEDSLSIPQLGGVARERCMNLAFPDGALAALRADATIAIQPFGHDAAQRAALRQRSGLIGLRESAEPTWHALVHEIAQVLERLQPAIVCCPHPLLDGHPDHVAAAAALSAALDIAPLPAPRVFLYVVHAAGSPHYPFGPSASVTAPPPWIHGMPLADTIYSHRVELGLRERKRAAIVANLDVHPRAPGGGRRAQGLLRRIAALKHAAAAALPGTRAHADSFLRRGPRPNELFYVHSRASFARLLATGAGNAVD